MSLLQWQVSGEKWPHAEPGLFIRGNRAIGGVGADALVGWDVYVPQADCMVGNVLVGVYPVLCAVMAGCGEQTKLYLWL